METAYEGKFILTNDYELEYDKVFEEVEQDNE